MRNFFLGLLISLGFVVSVCAEVRHFSNLSEVERADFFTVGSEVLEFREGDQLQFGAVIGGDLLELVEGSVCEPLRVCRTFYLRRVGEDFEVSLDGQVWLPLLSAVTGQLGFSLDRVDGVDRLLVKLDVNRRLCRSVLVEDGRG